MASSSSLPSASDELAVYITSSLETDLGVVFSPADTISSLKRIIEREHPVSYPDIGDIIVKAVKVKKKGSFYRLCDSMPVIKAFDRGEGTFFLHVEAVRPPVHIRTDQNVQEQNVDKLEGHVDLHKLRPSLEKGALPHFSPDLPPESNETKKATGDANMAVADRETVNQDDGKAKKGQVSTQKTKGEKKSKKKKVYEAPPVTETGFDVGRDNPDLEKEVSVRNSGNADVAKGGSDKKKRKKGKVSTAPLLRGHGNKEDAKMDASEDTVDEGTSKIKKGSDGTELDAGTDKTVSSKGHHDKTQSKKSKAAPADVANKVDDAVAAQIDDVVALNDDVAVLDDDVEKCKKKRKKGKVFTAPLLKGNENTENSEYTSKFESETLVQVGSQQENEGKEDPFLQDKKKRKNQVNSKSENETMKPLKKKSKKVKSKEKTVNSEKSGGESNKNVRNLDAENMNSVAYFSADTKEPSDEAKQSKEPEKRLKGQNPSLVEDMSYLSDDTTKVENDAKNEAMRYKVAVVPQKVRLCLFENNDNDEAIENTIDEGSAKIKKGSDGSELDAGTDNTISSKGHHDKTRSKKSKAATADMASKDADVANKVDDGVAALNDDVAALDDVVAALNDDAVDKSDVFTKGDDVANKADEVFCKDDVAASLEKEVSGSDAGQIISSVLTDLARESEANENIESQTQTNADVAMDPPNPNPKPEHKAKRCKLAVRKVPVKRGTVERDRADASGQNSSVPASVTGTIYSNNASDEGSRGMEKIDSDDGVALSQASTGTKKMISEKKDKTAEEPSEAEKENQNVDVVHETEERDLLAL